MSGILRAMVRLASGVFFLAVLALLATACADDEEITAAIVKEVSERKAVAPELVLSHPLDCDAIVMHSGTPGELPRARCYVRSGK